MRAQRPFTFFARVRQWWISNDEVCLVIRRYVSS